MGKTRAFLVTAAFLIARVSSATAAPKASAASEDEPEWDVGNPPGGWRTITIDTEETTWSNVDVSPDGGRIAFISDRGGADNLWIMDADGSNPRAITAESEHLVHNPWWSPDGH